MQTNNGAAFDEPPDTGSPARDSAIRNFKTIMISDANASRNDGEHNATLSIFLQAFGGVYSTDEVISLIGGKTAA